MRFVLTRHPGLASAITGVAVQAVRLRRGLLALRYVADDPGGALVTPPPGPADRTDGLWRRTCFEAFVRAPRADGYLEINLSPSTAWAAYRFDGYRAGMAEAAEVGPPEIAAGRTAAGFELSATVDLSRVAALAGEGPWRLALSAVVEDAGGMSYWALAHPPGEADFHHAAGFAGELGGNAAG